MVDWFVNGEMKQNKQTKKPCQPVILSFFTAKLPYGQLVKQEQCLQQKMLVAKMSTRKCYSETTGHRIVWCVNYISVFKKETQLHLKYFV